MSDSAGCSGAHLSRAGAEGDEGQTARFDEALEHGDTGHGDLSAQTAQESQRGRPKGVDEKHLGLDERRPSKDTLEEENRPKRLWLQGPPLKYKLIWPNASLPKPN